MGRIRDWHAEIGMFNRWECIACRYWVWDSRDMENKSEKSVEELRKELHDGVARLKQMNEAELNELNAKADNLLARLQADVTIGGGSSETNVSTQSGGLEFRGGWGNILIPYDVLVWGIKGFIGLFRKKKETK